MSGAVGLLALLRGPMRQLAATARSPSGLPHPPQAMAAPSPRQCPVRRPPRPGTGSECRPGSVRSPRATARPPPRGLAGRPDTTRSGPSRRSPAISRPLCGAPRRSPPAPVRAGSVPCWRGWCGLIAALLSRLERYRPDQLGGPRLGMAGRA
jgi:hypothetical protein